MSDIESDRCAFAFEPGKWLEINAMTKDVVGMTMHDLGKNNPEAAYAMFRSVMLDFATNDGGGQSESQADTYQIMAALLPEEVSRPTSVDIHVFDTIDDDGSELPRLASRGTSTILKFTVEPPNEQSS